MVQNQNTEIAYLFYSLDSYRVKYLKLLTEGSAGEELNYCQQAIEFYLSAISKVKGSIQKNRNHIASPFKSVSRWLTGMIKSKPKFEDVHAI